MKKSNYHGIIWRAALIVAFTTAIAAPGRAGEEMDDSPPQSSPVMMPRSQQFDLRSALGREYRIFIAEPSADGSIEPPPGGYAVFYVLDGNAMFGTAVDAVRFQRGMTPALVVGVGYPADGPLDIQKRYRDFTPPTPPEHIWSRGTSPRARPDATGGEDDFLEFIESILKPEVERRFPVDRTRQSIFGHSLAGRFVLHTLFTKPEAFSHYIAASPSIWWNDRSIVREARAFVDARDADAPAISLLLTAAEFEQRVAPGTPPARAEFFAMARMVDSARELAALLEPLADRGVSVAFIEYPGENHGSVVPSALSRSVRFSLRNASPPPADGEKSE